MIFSITMKLVFGLIGLLLVVRLLGKKSMSEITPFDLVYTLVLGGILEESTYDDSPCRACPICHCALGSNDLWYRTYRPKK